MESTAYFHIDFGTDKPYSSMENHALRKFENDSNEHIDNEKSYLNDRITFANYERQLKKYTSKKYMKEYNAKQIKNHRANKVVNNREELLQRIKDNQKGESKHSPEYWFVMQAGGEFEFNQIKDKAKTLHPEWSDKELDEHLSDSYKDAYNKTARKINQKFNGLTICTGDFHADETTPHMQGNLIAHHLNRYNNLQMDVGSSLREHYGKEKYQGHNLQRFRRDTDTWVLDNLQTSLKREIGSKMDDLELFRKDDGITGRSQLELEKFNTEVAKAVAPIRQELEIKKQELADEREEFDNAKIEGKKDLATTQDKNIKLKMRNKRLHADNEQLVRDKDDAESEALADQFNYISNAKELYYDVSPDAFKLGSLAPYKPADDLDGYVSEDLNAVQQADPNEVLEQDFRKAMATDMLKNYLEKIEDAKRKAKSRLKAAAEWAREKFRDVKKKNMNEIADKRKDLDIDAKRLTIRENNINQKDEETENKRARFEQYKEAYYAMGGNYFSAIGMNPDKTPSYNKALFQIDLTGKGANGEPLKNKKGEPFHAGDQLNSFLRTKILNPHAKTAYTDEEIQRRVNELTVQKQIKNQPKTRNNYTLKEDDGPDL